MLVIWDYFGVMAQDAFWYTIERVAEHNGMSAEIKKLHDQVNLGTVSWDDYCRAVSSDIGVPLKEVVARYQDHKINQQAILAIHSLSDHQHVLLSNASHTYLLPIMERLGLNTLFARVFVSSEIGYSKPDPRAFAYVLEQMSISADEAVMVDDSASNIDSACELGMHGIIYEPGIDLIERISRLVS